MKASVVVLLLGFAFLYAVSTGAVAIAVVLAGAFAGSGILMMRHKRREWERRRHTGTGSLPPEQIARVVAETVARTLGSAPAPTPAPTHLARFHAEARRFSFNQVSRPGPSPPAGDPWLPGRDRHDGQDRPASPNPLDPRARTGKGDADPGLGDLAWWNGSLFGTEARGHACAGTATGTERGEDERYGGPGIPARAAPRSGDEDLGTGARSPMSSPTPASSRPARRARRL